MMRTQERAWMLSCISRMPPELDYARQLAPGIDDSTDSFGNGIVDSERAGSLHHRKQVVRCFSSKCASPHTTGNRRNIHGDQSWITVNAAAMLTA